MTNNPLSHGGAPTVAEIKSWLVAFQTCVQSAFYMIPNDIYSFLRGHGYLDIEHDVTDKGRALIQEQLQ